MTPGLVLAAAGAGAGAALLALSVRRPALAAGFMLFAVPLTTGLPRGGLVPALRPSEAIVLVVLVGALAHQLPLRTARRLTTIDLVVAAYSAVSVVVPTFVLLFKGTPTDTDTWRTVVSPLEFGVVYFLFSRLEFSSRELRLAVKLTLAAGAVVAAVAILEVLDPFGFRELVNAYYPPAAGIPGDSTYRPDSLVGHFSAAGGVLLLDAALAVAVLTVGPSGFSTRFTLSVACLCVAGIVATQTFAPLLALPICAALVVAHTGGVPRRWWLAAAAVPVAALVLWPAVSDRFAEQGLLGPGGLTLVLPSSMETRVRYWQEFFLPSLEDALWTGTGTVIPSTVPDRLMTFVDNEYLWAGFRAGILGIAALIALLTSIAATGWQARYCRDPLRRTLGAAATASAVGIAVMGITAQYITFGGLVQEFAMFVGLAAAFTRDAGDAPVTRLARQRSRAIRVRAAAS